MNHRGTKRGAALLLAGLLSVGLVPSALAAQDNTPALEKIAGHSTGYSDQEGGVAEIVAYSQDNQKFYLVNGREQKLDIVSLAGLTAGEEGQSLTLEQRLDVSQMIPGFAFGDLTSVAVDPVHDRVAVAVQAEDYAANGAILLLKLTVPGNTWPTTPPGSSRTTSPSPPTGGMSSPPTRGAPPGL